MKLFVLLVSATEKMLHGLKAREHERGEREISFLYVIFSGFYNFVVGGLVTVTRG